MYTRHILGKNGEDEAVKYLEKQGYTIIERNFMCKQGEIDIIALNEKYLVFVEIKSRTSNEFGLPSESVTERKKKHMIKAIQYYLYKRNLENVNIRIDVIEVYVKDEKYTINHIKQIIWIDIYKNKW